jgi:Tfp pilus assembly protein PilE
VIIGVLAAIGIPAYNNYVNKARAAACLANRRTIATAMGLYFAENTHYPATVNALGAYIDNLTDLKCSKDLGIDNYVIVGETETESSSTVVIRCNAHHEDTPHPHEDLVVGTGKIEVPSTT